MLYKWLGGISIAMLAAAFALSVYILTGKHSKKATFTVGGIVLTLMIAITVLCAVIYRQYG